MSVENLKEYARRCATEPELRAAAIELGILDVEGHIRHAASLDLDWTMDDMIAFRKEVIESEDGFDYLTEEELEQIAGGGVSMTAMVVGVGVGMVVVAAASAGAAVATNVTAGW